MRILYFDNWINIALNNDIEKGDKKTNNRSS
jgi:hypothetical protein